jgi:hypothetical protein
VSTPIRPETHRDSTPKRPSFFAPRQIREDLDTLDTSQPRAPDTPSPSRRTLSFQTMIDPEFADNYGGKKRDRPVGGMGGGGGGGGGMGGGGGGGRGSNVHGTGRIRGIDHSAPMAGG